MHSFCFSFLIWGFPASPLGFFISVRLLRNFIKVIDRLRISSHDADYKSMNRNSFSSKCGASPPRDFLWKSSYRKLVGNLTCPPPATRCPPSPLPATSCPPLAAQTCLRPRPIRDLEAETSLRGADSGRRRGQPLERGGCSSAHLGRRWMQQPFASLNTQSLYVNNYFVQLHLLWINCTLLCYNSLLTEIQISMPEII